MKRIEYLLQNKNSRLLLFLCWNDWRRWSRAFARLQIFIRKIYSAAPVRRYLSFATRPATRVGQSKWKAGERAG